LLKDCCQVDFQVGGFEGGRESELLSLPPFLFHEAWVTCLIGTILWAQTLVLPMGMS
jgi:hypothetical protein